MYAGYYPLSIQKSVCIGDSITNGWNTGTYRVSWTNYLSDRIQSIAFYNKGIAAQTSTDIIARWPTDVTAIDPDYVFYMAGTNDIYFDLPLSTTMDNLNLAYNWTMANNTDARFFLCLQIPRDQFNAADKDLLDEMNAAYQAWAVGKTNVVVLDFWSVMEDPTTPRSMNVTVCSDTVHPNVAGHQLIANSIPLGIFANTIGLSTTTGSGAEGGDVTLSLKLDVGQVGPASAIITSADGTAIAGTDYTAFNQVVTIPAGENSVDFVVHLLSDGKNEAGDKTFTVTLSNPVNATLGTNTVATITIIDDGNGLYNTGMAIKTINLTFLLIIIVGVITVLYVISSLLVMLKSGFDVKIFALILTGGVILGLMVVSFVVLTYINGEMYNAISAFNI
jgi:lysophospholipase L1-like esterase